MTQPITRARALDLAMAAILRQMNTFLRKPKANMTEKEQKLYAEYAEAYRFFENMARQKELL